MWQLTLLLIKSYAPSFWNISKKCQSNLCLWLMFLYNVQQPSNPPSHRIIWCNVLYSRISQASLHCLQLAKSAAAGLITGSRKQEHTTPTQASSPSLRWLSVKYIVDFLKNLLLIYKAFHGKGLLLHHWSADSYEPGCTLRSAHQGLHVAPRVLSTDRGLSSFFLHRHQSCGMMTCWSPVCRLFSSFKSFLKAMLYMYIKSF